MQIFGAILLVAALFAVVAVGAQWLRTTDDLDASARTVEGYLMLMEGLYAYRADNVSQWPSAFADLTSYLPHLPIDPNDPMQAGANGEGGRYTLSVSGANLALVSTVATEAHARSVVREFGSNGAYVSAANGFAITVAVPPPGNVTLMQQTLLTDGTNKMHRPVWMQNVVAAGDACAGTGMALNANGRLMRCNGGVWQNY